MSVCQRENRQEGKGLATSVTEAASDANPIVMFIVRLLAAATMPDYRLAFTNRALTQNDVGASCGPVGSQVVLVGGKWDKKNRGNGALPGTVTLPRSQPKAEPFTSSKEKSSTGKRIAPKRASGYATQRISRLSAYQFRGARCGAANHDRDRGDNC